MPTAGDPTAQTLLGHLTDRAGAHDIADLNVDERGLGTEVEAALSAQYASRPAADGTAGQVLAINSLDPLVTEWVTGGEGGGGVTLEQVQDDLGNTSLIAGTSLTKVYDDGAGTITLNVDAGDFEAAGAVASHTSDTEDAHDASAISVADTGALLVSTNVEDALAEIIDLIVDVETDASNISTLLSTSGKGVVQHGATAGTARPTGFAFVEWVGSVEPTNAIDGDTWIDTA